MMKFVHEMQALRNGLSRFYDEGFYLWSRQQVQNGLKGGLTTSDPKVLEQLRRWERTGFIKLTLREDEFLTVLRQWNEFD